MHSIVACCKSGRAAHKLGHKEHAILVSETNFTLNEIEALFVLFKKVSCSIIDDCLIHKEEFLLALFNNSNKHSLFADRLFELFDLKKNGVIEFGEFVKSLSVFHPNAPVEDKISFVFRLYDLKCTGFIERDEVKELVLALFNESDMSLSDEVIEEIVDKTISDADVKGDGRIDQDEWKALVARYPSILDIMTIPLLKELTLAFPSFVLNTRVQDSQLLS